MSGMITVPLRWGDKHGIILQLVRQSIESAHIVTGKQPRFVRSDAIDRHGLSCPSGSETSADGIVDNLLEGRVPAPHGLLYEVGYVRLESDRRSHDCIMMHAIGDVKMQCDQGNRRCRWPRVVGPDACEDSDEPALAFFAGCSAESSARRSVARAGVAAVA